MRLAFRNWQLALLSQLQEGSSKITISKLFSPNN